MNTNNPRSPIDFEHYPLRELYAQYILSHVTSGHAKETLRFYKYHLGQFLDYLEENQIDGIEQVTVAMLRIYFAQYQENHTRNGAAVQYRAVRAFFYWVWDEYELEWKNPIKKISITADPVVPIHGVDPDDVDKLFESAKLGEYPERDCALLAILLDTGIRKSSCINILKRDVNIIDGSIYIRHTKNHKPLMVYLGSKSKRYIRKYMKTLSSIPDDHPFWVTEKGTPLSINGMREITRRICKRAGIPEYSAHDFRRYFALESWRNGADIYAVSELLGQSGIEVTKRYLATGDEDRRAVHARTSPLDHRK